MKRILIVMPIFLISCCGLHTEVSYEYEGTIIKRVDTCGKTAFYYGDVNKKNPIIWAEYSGINSGFSGYLSFAENGKVTLLSGDGYFQAANEDSSKFEFKDILANQIPTNRKSVYCISLSTRYEQEDNCKTNSEVKADYDIDDNEWW